MVDLEDIERWLADRKEHREPAQATLILDRLPELIAELREARSKYDALEEYCDGRECVLQQLREQLARAVEVVPDVDEWATEAQEALDISNESPVKLAEELARLEAEHRECAVRVARKVRET